MTKAEREAIIDRAADSILDDLFRIVIYGDLDSKDQAAVLKAAIKKLSD